MSEVEGLAECDPKKSEEDFFKKYNQLLVKLSSLRDKGKLLIPNLFPEKYGSEKATAYQGFRDEALEYLRAAYYITASVNYRHEGYNKKSVKLEPESDILLRRLDELDKSSHEFRLLKQAQKIKFGLDQLPIIKGKAGMKYSLDGPSDDEEKSQGWSSKKAMWKQKGDLYLPFRI